MSSGNAVSRKYVIKSVRVSGKVSVEKWDFRGRNMDCIEERDVDISEVLEFEVDMMGQ